MKSILLAFTVSVATALLGAFPALAQKAAPSVALPHPRTEGKVSVERALKERRSVRSLAPAPLSLQELGQLCWAAQGVTDDKGHRTAPSAMATYPLELRVMAGNVEGLAPGIYRYRPDKHELLLLSEGDRRAAFQEKAVGQAWIAKAPALLVITGVPERITKRAKERGVPFMWVEAGLAAQGFFLQAAAMGLGSTYVGGFNAEAARSFLALPAGEELMAVLPVGHKS
jgi:SagB-type dehydrogenase family enzyme